MKLREMIDRAISQGYNPANARAKVCQDIVLKAISESSMSRNVTIKGKSHIGMNHHANGTSIDLVRFGLSKA